MSQIPQTQTQTQTPSAKSAKTRRSWIIKAKINIMDLEDVEERVDIIAGAMIYDIRVLLVRNGVEHLGGEIERIIREYVEKIKLEYDMLITGSEE